MANLYGDVFTELRGKVEEIYVYFQERLGITSGDQAIDLALTEDEATRILADTITKTLKFQKGE